MESPRVVQDIAIGLPPGDQNYMFCKKKNTTDRQNGSNSAWRRNRTFERFCCHTFPEIPSVWRHNRTHSVFALRTNFRAWRARGQHFCFAEECGVKDTCDAALHVQQSVGNTLNIRVQARETQFRSSKDVPQRWLISPIWAKKRPTRIKRSFLPDCIGPSVLESPG